MGFLVKRKQFSDELLRAQIKESYRKLAEKKNSPETIYSALSERLKSQMETVLKVIESTINRHMGEISDYVSQGKDNPPILGIKVTTTKRHSPSLEKTPC